MSAFVLGAFAPVLAENISTAYVSTSVNCIVLTTTLSYGKHDSGIGAEVSALQNFLHSNNYLSVSATGYFGPLTRAAVKLFQQENGLRADGIVGVQTRAHILAKGCPDYNMAAPTIGSISPSTATAGSTVTLYGSGFAASSIVHFAIGGITSNLTVGSNGTTLSFAVPSYIGPYCKPGMMCPLYVAMISNGTYPVYVENASGSISNTVQLTVIGSPNPTAQ